MSDSQSQHYRLVITMVALRQFHSQSSGKADHQRLADTVSVVRSSVARLNENLQWGRSVRRMSPAIIFPRQIVFWNMKVADNVACASRYSNTALVRSGPPIPDFTTSSCRGPLKRFNSGRVTVRLEIGRAH